MDATEQFRPPRRMDALLAGLQSGMLGVFAMLAWAGLTGTWQTRSFWTPENLLASVFHPHREIPLDFGLNAISGLALYLVVYGLLGMAFAAIASTRPMRAARATLLAVLVSLVWYYFSFHLLWKTISPAIGFLNAEQPAIVGHLIYGLVLGRFHAYLPRPATTVPAAAPVDTEVKTG